MKKKRYYNEEYVSSLLREYKVGGEGVELLLKEFDKMAIAIANTFKYYKFVALDDLRQVSSIAAYLALDSFDPSRSVSGGSFNFFTKVIRTAQLRAVKNATKMTTVDYEAVAPFIKYQDEYKFEEEADNQILKLAVVKIVKAYTTPITAHWMIPLSQHYVDYISTGKTPFRFTAYLRDVLGYNSEQARQRSSRLKSILRYHKYELLKEIECAKNY